MISQPDNSKLLRRAVIYSAVAHIFFVLIVTYMPGLGLSFLGDKPLRVSAWVELPKGTSEDIGLGMKKAESLPKSTIEEQKKIFEPEKPAQQTMAPQKAAVAVKGEKDEDDNKMKVPEKKRPKVDAKTTRKNEEKPKSRTDKKISDALAKIDKVLAGRTIVPESAQVKDNAEGYKYGTGTEPLKVLPSDPEYLKYQAMVRAKIISEWIVPLKYTEQGTARVTARLEVMINTDGEVVSIRWESPSGDATFDQSAIRSVKKASPFPKPPDRLAWEAYNEGFLVEFDPRLKTTM